MESAMAALQYNSTGAVRGDPFQQLTSMVTNKRRMSAVKEARANGLTPDMGDQYYGFIRDRLTDFGDMQGAEMIEGKRLQAVQLKTESDYKKAQTEGTILDNAGKRQEINSNAPERKLRVAEAGVVNDQKRLGQTDRQLDQRDAELRWEKETFDSPQDKFERDKELTRIKYNYDLNLEDRRIGGAIRAEEIKRGRDLGKPLTSQEAKMGQAAWISHLSQLNESDQEADKQKLKRLEESSGMSFEDLITKAGSTDQDSMIARAELAKQGTIVAMNYRELKRNFPEADEGKLWDEATSVPSDARLLRVKGKYYWYVSDTEAYPANVE